VREQGDMVAGARVEGEGEKHVCMQGGRHGIAMAMFGLVPRVVVPMLDVEGTREQVGSR
jgi:hypothetical protein